MTPVSSMPASCSQFFQSARLVHVDQRKLQNVRGLGDAALARQQLRTAQSKEVFRAQPYRVQPRPIAVAVTHREVNFLARKIHMMQCGRRGAAPADRTCARMGELAPPEILIAGNLAAEAVSR
jgi:hypothetical protein